VINSREQTRANYDRLSRWYDLLAGSSERGCKLSGLARLDVQPGERVLEVGSGTGESLLLLRQAAGPAGFAFGGDLSTGMCEVARLRVAKTELAHAQPGIVCADAVALPVRDEACDAILMSFTLELFPPVEMEKVLAECTRVLREGGRLGVIALSVSSRPGAMERLYIRAHQRFPAWIDCRPIPVSALLMARDFAVEHVTRHWMGGLPVEVVVARKRAEANPDRLTFTRRAPL
jgi:demethylmenaquinone methyltransferase/2-methoxy-6-polyprenyl-1,4-benzoquinol methylase